ncbi:ethanolamine utilization protein EutH [Hutsoniella sourekii]|uniref:ethanolamine utilization protein EutH n=1 Tax=Hutsoniella sourekii TaxID=87650 RepID=UPI000484A73A|nr:ethanolamine utilization protein EutH [Hutsoniella sourekii]
MLISQILNGLLALFALLGGIDAALGNRWGLGDRFKEGFQAIGSIGLGMIGMICLAPVLADFLSPYLSPLFQAIGADPAMLGSFLAIDMGGFPLAQELGQSSAGVNFSGIIMSSMFGCTLVYALPVGFNLVAEEDYPLFARGIIAGLIAIPLGGLVGGLVAGYDWSFILPNLLPTSLLSLLLILGFLKIPERLVSWTLNFAKGLNAVIYLGLALAAAQHLSGYTLLSGMGALDEAILTVGSIGVTLLGAYPLVDLLTRLLDQPLHWVGNQLGISSQASAGFLVNLVNCVPVFDQSKEMDSRGKVMNFAFIVPATSVFGAHLAYTNSVAEEVLPAMILAKLSAGLLAVLLAYLFTGDLTEEAA